MRRALLVFAIAAACGGCDRNLEPFDPDERPSRPDLSKIFPEGFEQADPAPPVLPPPPGESPGSSPLPAGLAAAPAAAAGDAGAGVLGRVELAPGFEGPPDAVLFVILRRSAGGPPLAVKRVAAPRFPLEFSVGPADRMIQQMPFEGPFTLSARLDGDGNATSRSAGDLQGRAEGEFQPGDSGARILLDERL